MNDVERRTDRFPQRIEIEYRIEETRYQSLIGDLSEGGVYIYTRLDWAAGKPIEFRFRLPDGSETPIHGDGTVVWWEPKGFGVRFERLAAADRERIRSFVDSLPESLPTPARGSQWC